MKLTIYLAGAIRDGVKEDIAWREYFIQHLAGTEAVILNPLAGKLYNEKSKMWTIHNQAPDGKFIVKQDFWAVDHADLIVFNFLALADGYPMIGSLTEWGRSTSREVIRYTILPEKYLGHGNLAMFGLHPFLDQPAAKCFQTVEACADFTRQQVRVMNGMSPHFAGILS